MRPHAVLTANEICISCNIIPAAVRPHAVLTTKMIYTLQHAVLTANTFYIICCDSTACGFGRKHFLHNLLEHLVFCGDIRLKTNWELLTAMLVAIHPVDKAALAQVIGGLPFSPEH